LRPGQIEHRTHDYVRHGVTDLYGALNVTTGEVIAIARRTQDTGSKGSLSRSTGPCVDDLDVHVVLDNS
jgi:hypothetical protein